MICVILLCSRFESVCCLSDGLERCGLCAIGVNRMEEMNSIESNTSPFMESSIDTNTIPHPERLLRKHNTHPMY